MFEELFIKASFFRGGTSKGLIFNEANLPKEKEKWKQIFLLAMGSPDVYERQLNGIGGGLSSLSKVCVVGDGKKYHCDLTYEFFQVDVKNEHVDNSATCGNMSSAIGLFAFKNGILNLADGKHCIKIYDINTQKIILNEFETKNNNPLYSSEQISGVSGVSSVVNVAFLNPANTLGLGILPTKNPQDIICGVKVSIVDFAMPYVFINFSDIAQSFLSPNVLKNDKKLLKKLEQIRQESVLKLKMATSMQEAKMQKASPKIILLGKCEPFEALSHEVLNGYDIRAQAISMQQLHLALPVSGSLCMVAAANIEGTLVNQIAKKENLSIASPSGVIQSNIKMKNNEFIKAGIKRTAKELMRGEICVVLPMG